MAYKSFKYFIMICFIFCLYSFLYLPVHAETDTTPPRVTNITIDKTIVNVGDTVTFSVSVEEDGTGISDGWPRICMSGPDGCGIETSTSDFYDPTKEYYTGTYQLKTTITKDMAPGDYYINEVIVGDHSNNLNRYLCQGGDETNNYFYAFDSTAGYLKNEEPVLYIPIDLKLIVINEEYTKKTIATIKTVEIKNHEISYNSTIPVDVLFEGEIPDRFWFSIDFKVDYGDENSICATTFYIDKEDCKHDGMLYHLNLDPGTGFSSGKTGIYHISGLTIMDANSNTHRNYGYRLIETGQESVFSGIADISEVYGYDDIENHRVEIIGDDTISFTENPDLDEETPVISDVKIDNTKVKQSGVVTIDFTVKDNKLIDYIAAYVTQNNDLIVEITPGFTAYLGEYSPVKEYKGQIRLRIPRNAHTGICKITLYAIDSSSNMTNYYIDDLEIIEEFDRAFDIGSNSPDLFSKIDGLQDGETGFIQIRTQPFTVKKEIFNTIKDRDVNLVFYSNNYDWIFNGKSITKPKDIQIGIEAFLGEYIAQYDDGGTETINVLNIVFPDNGELPGKSQVRIQSNYLYDICNSMTGDDPDFYLYYKNNTGELELQENSNVAYVKDDDSPWCYFDITHNSTYCVSGKKINKNSKSAIVKAKKINISGLSHKIAAGKKVKLYAIIWPKNTTKKKLKWTSNNRKVATVSKNGVVTIKEKTGGNSVTITAGATDGSGKTASFKIKVMKGAVKKITIKGAKKTLKFGKTMKLKTVVKTTKGKPVNNKIAWTSSNTKYATVTSKGVVKALKPGKGKKVTITAMATDGSGKKKKVSFKIK